MIKRLVESKGPAYACIIEDQGKDVVTTLCGADPVAIHIRGHRDRLAARLQCRGCAEQTIAIDASRDVITKLNLNIAGGADG